VNEFLLPALKFLLASTQQNDTLSLYCIEGLRLHAPEIHRQHLEEITLLAANSENCRELALEVIEILDPEIVRRWPLMSCAFRHQYR
jgi:hypothetical protein